MMEAHTVAISTTGPRVRPATKKSPEVLVKIMLNEREVDLPLKSDVAPYYKWDEVRNYYKNVLK